MSDRQHKTGTMFILITLGLLLMWTAWSAMHRTFLLDSPEAAGPRAGSTTLPDMRIDINSATVAELSLLPAIGPGLAERIIADRQQRGPFTSADNLARVSGIGAATLERLRPFAVALPPAAPAPIRGREQGD